MRRMFLIAVASCALLAVAPATALARHGSRHHRAHHARVHHKKFGTDAAPTTTTTTTTPTATATVVSFANGLLTISANGATVSGMVTSNTDIKCVAPQTAGMMQPTGEDQSHDHGGWGGGNGGGDNGGSDHGGGDNGGEANQMCSTANLVATTPVLFADLSISSTGTNWDEVVLQVAPSTVPTVPDTDNDGD